MKKIVSYICVFTFIIVSVFCYPTTAMAVEAKSSYNSSMELFNDAMTQKFANCDKTVGDVLFKGKQMKSLNDLKTTLQNKKWYYAKGHTSFNQFLEKCPSSNTSPLTVVFFYISYESGDSILQKETYGLMATPSNSTGEMKIIFIDDVNTDSPPYKTKRGKIDEKFYAKVTGWAFLDYTDYQKYYNKSKGASQGLKLKVPSQKRSEVVVDEVSEGKYEAGSGIFGYPVSSHTTSAGYPYYSSGSWHGGVDFPVPKGTPVHAAADGTVVKCKALYTSYGHYITIKHNINGHTWYTYYCHNSKLLVKYGDKVKKGQKIALSGSTGNSTGPHCHFEIRKDGDVYGPNGTSVNPFNYLK